MFHSTVMRRPSDDQGRPHDEAAVARLRTPTTTTSTYDPTQDSPFTTAGPATSASATRPRPHTAGYQDGSAGFAGAAVTVPSSTAAPTYPGSGQPSDSKIILGSPTADALPPLVPPPPSRERASTTSTFYDPARADSAERRPLESPVSRPAGAYVHSPALPGLLPNHYAAAPEPVYQHSPPTTHAHPTPSSRQLSPTMPPISSTRRDSIAAASTASAEPPVATVRTRCSRMDSSQADQVQTPSRKADPMAFSSILSDANPPAHPTPTAPASKPRKVVRVSTSTPVPAASRNSSRQSSVAPTITPISRVPAKRKANGDPRPAKSTNKKARSKAVARIDERELQAIMDRLDAEASDRESGDFTVEKHVFRAKSLQRRLEIAAAEEQAIHLRRITHTEDLVRKYTRQARLGELRYEEIHGDDVYTAVQEMELEAEKERKKEMQRKRRRERTAAHAMEQKEDALAKAALADDEEERAKFLREAQRAEKKAQQTQIILARGDKPAEIRAVSPVEPNLAGGAMSSFSAVDEPRKSRRGGTRPRKSKEQKQAEKDSAEAAQAAIDKGEEPAVMTPPETSHPRIRLKLTNNNKDRPLETSPGPAEKYASKGYNQIYEQIWRDMARKDVSKVYKLASESSSIRNNNLRKTAILASKEAKRWQSRTNKGTKDLQARAKRVMREMLQFWKRNEKDERDLRRAAEKQETENAKKLEADREANRQKRKLNFLIQQTELYSHFIGKKIKTDEVERSTDQPDVAGPPKDPDGDTKMADDVAGLEEGAPPGAKVTNFGDLDFDADDDSALKAAAMANAQNAIQEAQAKAKAFNNGAADMDEEGELNFQNPAGMGDVDLEQPAMLQAQLKEYQLKGLNWLANLYEQGINGILADEMGLGKTVQSISVMAYLAEKHGIWGPFLVVAPASTLHNWQQEITKFVPRLKCLPYWGNANDRKVLRKFWDRKRITYTEDAPFHVLITSYQLVVSDVAYLQKMKWQYMILDEAQAIKSSQSSRWKVLLGFHCRNRLLLTGTPIQNNMQELWALLHFIMPTLFDSHDEFSEWFSKDIESHAASNTSLNEDQLKRLHMILKPFMLRRVKKHVQKELGDKIEIDLFCDLTYRQRKIYSRLRSEITLMDLLERAALSDAGDSESLMNLVMQFRKVCNHPDLFEPARITSPYSFGYFAETGSFLREKGQVDVAYSVSNLIEYRLPRRIWREDGRLDLPGRDNASAGFRSRYLQTLFSVWSPDNIRASQDKTFSWLRFADASPGEAAKVARQDVFARAVDLAQRHDRMAAVRVVYDDENANFTPKNALFRIVDRHDRKPLADVTAQGYLREMMNVSRSTWTAKGYARLEQCSVPKITAPPIDITCSSAGTVRERQTTRFNVPMRRALYGPGQDVELALVESKVSPAFYPPPRLLPLATAERKGFTDIQVPTRLRLVTDSGKLAKLDALLHKLKEEGHRVLLYFQMTRMIDLMEEYLTYRSYKYLRLDGSTKLEDRRDTVHDFQTRPEIFIFLLSTRAGGLGINLTTADTVIFYDSDWNPTIDSQAMDRAHRLGQTKQVTVYRMITRGTIEERIRKRAMQKEEVQKVVMTGGSGASGSSGVDFNAKTVGGKEARNREVALWLVDDDEAGELERLESERREREEKEGKKPGRGRKRKVDNASAGGAGGGGGSLEDLYHEGEGHFDDSARPSGAATPIDGGGDGAPSSKRQRVASGAGGKRGGAGGGPKKGRSARERLGE